MIRAPFGQTRLVYAGDTYADRAVLLGTARRLDRAFVAAHLDGFTAHDRTILAAVRAVPPGHALVRTPAGFVTELHPLEPRPGVLLELLRHAIARAMKGRRCAVALSGGLDSAIVLALAREVEPGVPAYVVAPQLPGYTELDGARRTARGEVRVVDVSADALVDALPHALARVEEPLYNLHPVSRWLLGRALREDGIETVLTGDGVDQVCTRDASCDYLPLVHALTQPVHTVAPFLDEDVVAHLLSLPADADKPAVRALGVALGLDEHLTHGPKQRRLAPPLDLSRHASERELDELARRIGLPRGRGDRARTLWTSLALLVRHLEIDV